MAKLTFCNIESFRRLTEKLNEMSTLIVEVGLHTDLSYKNSSQQETYITVPDFATKFFMAWAESAVSSFSSERTLPPEKLTTDFKIENPWGKHYFNNAYITCSGYNSKGEPRFVIQGQMEEAPDFNYGRIWIPLHNTEPIENYSKKELSFAVQTMMPETIEEWDECFNYINKGEVENERVHPIRF